MVGSLPTGIPKVVDCRQIDAQATNKMVTQDTRGFIQVRPPRRRNTYVLRLIVLLCVNEMIFERGPLPTLYNLGDRVIDLETNPNRLQLPYVAG